ncbi:UTP--glucose-1-phosphate uridylyltransferase [Mycoplasmopsis alligatoris]|uniref:UTP--glucose-1-phosphate uridylyltransferase n=1 Tax=Mycoplasmopsis alligatoris A21JP2 TaxID=747682 RepID=D4XW65_9BACT|nr:sugar phosphate nucleotidyltransferase [Mycoplasmopsis alligatoris]EFF41426.1 nucleotidyl transferase [Mycoplasmopsis alligatoris A21JP2]
MKTINENIKKIRKVIIPCAGWGTRFLPMTKTVHKELVPILNKPAIDYLVEEAIQSGAEEIILVISQRKLELVDYFNVNDALEKELKLKNKKKLLEVVKKTNRNQYIKFVIQETQKGLGDAILVCKDIIGNEPFGIILGDDLVKVSDGTKPAIKQLMEAYESLNGANIVGVQKVLWNKVNKYGIVTPKNRDERANKTFEIIGAIEKPEKEDAPSSRAILGRYVFNPEIFNILEKTAPGVGQEVQLVDSFDELMQTQKIFAFAFTGTRYDLGGVEGFIKANIDYALCEDSLNEEISAFIKSKCKKNK